MFDLRQLYLCRELAGQLREEVVQQLKKHNVKLYLVSIGPPERGTEFAKHTGFPDDQLLADPENSVYDALSLHNSVLDTFFNPKVWHPACCLSQLSVYPSYSVLSPITPQLY